MKLISSMFSQLRLANCHLDNVVYLIEDMDAACAQVEEFGRERFRTAVAMSQVIDGFNVKRTTGMDDSIGFFVMLTRYLERKFQAHLSFIHPTSFFYCFIYRAAIF